MSFTRGKWFQTVLAAPVMALARETAAAVRHPDVVKRFAEISAEPVGSSPAEQDAMLKKQVAQFRPIIQELGVPLG